MISPRYIAFAAAGLAIIAFSFLAGRISTDETPETGEGSGGGSERGSRYVAGSGSPGSSRPGKTGDSRRPEAPGSATEGGAQRNGEHSGLSEFESPPGKVGPAQKLFEKKGTRLFNENYALNEEIAKTLGLGEAEYTAVSQALAKTLDEIDTLREQSIEVRSRSASQLFLKIRSFGEKGAEVRTALQNDLRQQLGEERYAAFMLMTEDSLESEYFQFGRAYQTISFNFYESQNTGASRIRIVDEVHIPQGSGNWTIIQNKDNYDTLPENYQGYLDAANGITPAPTAPTSPAIPTSPPVTPSPSPTPVSPSPN